MNGTHAFLSTAGEVHQCVRGFASAWGRFPAYDRTGRGVDELLQTTEDIARQAGWVRRLEGNTIDDEPLFSYSSDEGDGGRQTLYLSGGAHGNEVQSVLGAVCAMVVVSAFPMLRQRITWRIMPVVDLHALRANSPAEGRVLDSGVLVGRTPEPYTVEDYYNFMYRPPVPLHPGARYPVGRFDRPARETWATMRFYSALRPSDRAAVIDLHGTDTNGRPWYVLSPAARAWADALGELVTGFAGARQPRPEVLSSDAVAWLSDHPHPGVFVWHPAPPVRPATAGLLIHWLAPSIPFIFAEAPTFEIIPPEGDRAALTEVADQLSRGCDYLDQIWHETEPYLQPGSRSDLEPAARDALNYARRDAKRWRSWEGELPPGLYAGAHASRYGLYHLRAAGMLSRAFQQHRAEGNPAPQLLDAITQLDSMRRGWLADWRQQSGVEPHPLERVLNHYVNTILTVAATLLSG